MKIRSSPVIPSLICPGVPLDGAQAGVVVRIIDSDASVYANYLVQTADGTQYCGQMDVRRRRNRDALLRRALESGRSVMVGATSHALFESTGGSNPNDARSGRP